MKRLLILILLSVLMIGIVKAQNQTEGYILPAIIVDGDTIPCITTQTHIVIGFRSKISKRQQKQYTKLVRNVIKVYPYAKLSAEKMKEYDEMLALISNKNDQQKAMKSVEKQLYKEFEKDIKRLTFSQGVILIKLIDRETGKTSYKIINEFRGKMRAFFYQTIAQLFKYDLKTKYDPKGEDKEIEKIVQLIENKEI